MATHKLLLLPGDGIGPEVMSEVEKIVGWFRKRGLGFETETDLVGGSAYDAHGAAISEDAMKLAQAADAVLFGAVGGAKWDSVPYAVRPEAGLLRRRKDLGLFANLRPAICYPALADASSLKREVVEGLDIMIELEHVLADNCAMQLVRYPKQFDVIVTDNLFGDILSDIAAMLTGSLGMLPSASLGAEDPATGKRKALYETVHGSAPDIAGKGLANPIAMIGSFGMALRYSFGLLDEADRLDRAIANVLASGTRTKDIAGPGMNAVGTQDVGDAIVKELEAQS